MTMRSQGDLVVFPRRAIYVHAILYLVVALLALGAGYLMGRGDARTRDASPPASTASDQVFVEGRLMYDKGNQLVGDDGAVILVLPHGGEPRTRLTVQGLRVQDPPPDERQAEVRALRKLGGQYARADANGQFSLVLPKAKKCWLLFISRQTDRGADSPLQELDYEQIARFFVEPNDLIGRRKYAWVLRDFHAAKESIEHNFGFDES
jgi:hypothetical protein